ncbi:N-acetylglucosamine kinase [Streptomyces sp. NEAU-Y11]|uniref:N-acetylglucosamine kinase n=1 Tax=Streptomyces cucumeris TaxID=2962890 RepID=UPI0020C92B85|nr:BadF/BadG/BcrA/BcrD ATPase family protein [Streptomyces sp. NEAU-Y11]MCP9207918.1 ATPase [Streptomyces sp. NEAU-Y11]
MTGPCVLGIDSGGSGVRVGVARVGQSSGGSAEKPLTWSSPTPAAVGERGIDAAGLLARVLPAAHELVREAGAGRVDAVCVGATGMASLGDDLRATLPDALTDAFGVRRLALAADAVTAYAGALGQRPGAVVAAGTGMIALGALPGGRGAQAHPGGWRRADGWGHLLGDCGGGAWIGRAGLEAAMRAYDGREGGSRPLLDRAEALFGPAAQLPGVLYPRQDRPAVLASFAPEVGRLAGADPVAHGILRDAARHIAQAAEAVCPRVASPEVALTGGLFRMGAPLLDPLRTELSTRLPAARLTEAPGDPLDGALCVAAALATHDLRLPRDAALLTVVDTTT